MHIQNVIEELGYRPQEAKVYLAALTMGESTVTDLAARVKLPRTTVQSIAEDLQRKGLLQTYPKKRRRYWAAVDPQKLLIRLEEREAALKSVMPELQGMRYHLDIKPAVRIYRGAEELKQIMDDIIEAKRHIAAVVSWDEWSDFFANDYIEDFIERRCKHFLRIKFLVPRSRAAAVLKERDEEELRSTRFLPENISIRTSTYLYGNKVAIISLNRKEPVGILIEDTDIARTMEVFFTALWERSSGT